MKNEIKAYLSAIGTKGGKAATGEKKDRRVSAGDPDYYKKLAAKRKKKTGDAPGHT